MFVLFLDKASEVVEAGLLPFSSVLQLVLHALIDLLPALFVDGWLGLLPDVNEVFNFFYTTGIAQLQFFPKGVATLEAIVPGYMMEPQQVALRAGVDIVVNRTEWLSILRSGVRTSMGTIETNANGVSPMVVNGAPFDGVMCDIAARLRAVVLIEGEVMVQSQGHHVIDAGLSRS